MTQRDERNNAAEAIDMKVAIDCPHCAAKVEKALNDDKRIVKAVLDFDRKTLHVESSLDEETIRGICLAASDEISFPEEESCCSACNHRHHDEEKDDEIVCSSSACVNRSATPDFTPTLEFHPVIDCPVCAGKVNDALNARKDIEKAEYNFNQGRLRVTTNLSRE